MLRPDISIPGCDTGKDILKMQRGKVDEQRPLTETEILRNLKLVELIRQCPFVFEETLLQVYCENVGIYAPSYGEAYEIAKAELMPRVKMHFYECIRKQLREISWQLRFPKMIRVSEGVAQLIMEVCNNSFMAEPSSILSRVCLGLNHMESNNSGLHMREIYHQKHSPNTKTVYGELIYRFFDTVFYKSGLEEQIWNRDAFSAEFARFIEEPIGRSLLCDFFTAAIWLKNGHVDIDILQKDVSRLQRRLSDDHLRWGLYDEARAAVHQYEHATGQAAICIDLANREYWLSKGEVFRPTRSGQQDVMEYLILDWMLHGKDRQTGLYGEDVPCEACC